MAGLCKRLPLGVCKLLYNYIVSENGDRLNICFFNRKNWIKFYIFGVVHGSNKAILRNNEADRVRSS